MPHVFLEAESFSDTGGWVIDTQSVETMGSPYLMAHGCGTPVKDASTQINIPQSGMWHVWARTRNWTKVWKRGHSGGVFNIAIDGKKLPSVLGTGSEYWAWQKAGTIKLASGCHKLFLQDLSGFNGRCDAIYLASEEKDTPPDDIAEFAAFRIQNAPVSKTDDPENYDLIVCGGGYAGMCAALAAELTGQRVLLIQDRGLLGGCNSSEIRVWLGGLTRVGKYPELGHITAAIAPLRGRPDMSKCGELFEDARKERCFRKDYNLLLNEMVVAVEMDKNNPERIEAVISKNVRSGAETRRKARVFADCTGDALLARLCGCRTMYGRESSSTFKETLAPQNPDRQVMGHSVLWEARETPEGTVFPDIDWGIEFNDSNAIQRSGTCWDWEAGQYRDQVKEIEFIRDYGLMTVVCNWSWLKNHSSEKERWKNYELFWVSPIGGKRESHRVVGDRVLTQCDIENKVEYEDATASISWSIDLHFPDPENERRFGEAFQSCAYHRGIGSLYEVPYRCLYAKDVQNLFLGGRAISASHVAFSCIRVMRTLGMLGEVVGMASSICKKHNCSPRTVYERHLDELKTMMRTPLRLGEDHGYCPDSSESYHFMRRCNEVGNPGENVWISLNPDGSPSRPVPSAIHDCIVQLDITHKSGSKWR